MSQDSINAALALLASQTYGSEVVETAEPKEKSPKQSRKASKMESSQPEQGSTKTNEERKAFAGEKLPEAGTIVASEFIKAMRQPKMTQQDKIRAIASYVGYNPRDIYGRQEAAAFQKAKRDLHGVDTSGPTREEQRSALRSVTGFVQGLPDSVAPKIADLEAREKLSAESLAKHEKDAADSSRDQKDRDISRVLAQVEAERIKEIRADLNYWTRKG